MKSYNMILIEKEHKFQRYQLEKLINMNILQVEKYYLLIKDCSPLEKDLEKQTKKLVGALKSLGISNKKDEYKQIEGIFPKNILHDMMIKRLKEIIKLQDIIKTD